MSIADSFGRNFFFPRPPSRVVSLVPSLTETLFDLGAGDSVAGITDFCIFPADPRLNELERVGGTKNPSVEQIRALAPDLVYVNLEENLERHAHAISEFAPVFASEPKTVGDVGELLITLGRIHHRERSAEEWRSMLKAEHHAAESSRRAFSFACPIWKNPWMWCGGDTYVSNLVSVAGGTNVLSGRLRYPAIPLAEVRALSPQIIFLPDEPFAFSDEDRADLAVLIPSATIIGPFPGHLLTWHGSRTVAGLRFLRESLAR